MSKNDENVSSRLLVAKSKVVPARKVITVPRLELCAVHLLAKLWGVVRLHLSTFNIEMITFWSDSEIVLHWVKSHPSSLKTFVCNRIAVVQEKTEGCYWRYVPTNLNSADIVSRGCSVEEIRNSMWFSGPDLIKLNSEFWPRNSHLELTHQDLSLEKKKNRVALVNVECQVDNSILKMIEKVSSYTRIIRIMAYVLRFVRCINPKSRTVSNSLEVRELDTAVLKIIDVIQHIEFLDDIENITKCSVSNHDHVQRLDPFIQLVKDDGINTTLIRVGGCLSRAPISYVV